MQSVLNSVGADFTAHGPLMPLAPFPPLAPVFLDISVVIVSSSFMSVPAISLSKSRWGGLGYLLCGIIVYFTSSCSFVLCCSR